MLYVDIKILYDCLFFDSDWFHFLDFFTFLYDSDAPTSACLYVPPCCALYCFTCSVHAIDPAGIIPLIPAPTSSSK